MAKFIHLWYTLINIFIGHELALIVLYVTSWTLLYAPLTLVEIAAMKALYILQWHRMAMFDDNFLSKIFFGFNCMVTSLILTVRISTQEYYGNYHYQAIRNLFGMHPGPIKELRPKIKFW